MMARPLVLVGHRRRLIERERGGYSARRPAFRPADSGSRRLEGIPIDWVPTGLQQYRENF